MSFSVYRLSPVAQVADSYYTLLVAQNICQTGSVSLDAVRVPEADELSYQIVDTARGRHYRYGLGSSVLSVPFVAAANALGVSLTRPDGTYDPRAERRLQRTLAAGVTALAVVFLYLTARFFTSPKAAVGSALLAAFGTSLWGTASRALWSHTWGTLLLAVAVYLVARAEMRSRPSAALLLGTVLAWSYFVRPTNAVPAAAIALWALLRGRREGRRLVTALALWLVAFLAFSWVTRGELLSVYYQGRRLQVSLFGEALFGHLISPSRGMLLTTPVFLWIAAQAARYARGSTGRLAALAGAVAVGHLLVLSAMYRWWGGHAAGSRVTTELVPWFFLLACAAWPGVRRRAAVIGLVLAGWGVFTHGSEALFREIWDWNSLPRPVDSDPGRVWDWRHPQFLAALRPPEPPDAVPDLPLDQPQPITGAAAAMLARGWRPPGPDGAVMYARSACLRFRSSAAAGSERFPPVLRLEVTVARPVTLSLLVDGAPAAPMQLEPGPRSFSVSLSPSAGQGTIVYLRASEAHAVAIRAVTLRAPPAAVARFGEED